MDFLNHLQRPLQTFVGVAFLALGAMLLANTTAAVGLLLLLLCIGLVLAGVLRFIEALQATRWRPLHLGAAVVLAASGPALLLWHTATLPILALGVALVLLIGGLSRLVSTLGQPRGSRWRGLLSSVTGLFASVLVIFWPRLSLWVVAVAFGGWLIMLGLHTLFLAWATRLPTAPRWLWGLRRLGSGAHRLGLGAGAVFRRGDRTTIRLQQPRGTG